MSTGTFKINVQLSEAQREFVNDWEHTYILFLAGVRAGKTFAGIIKDIIALLRKPGTKGWIVSSDHNAGLEAWDQFLSLIPPEYITSKDQRARRIYLVGNRLIEFRSAEYPENLIARGVDFVHLDEGGKVKYRVFQNLVSRQRGRGGFQVWVTTTPYLSDSEGEYWIKSVFFNPDTRWLNSAVYRSKTLDNPIFRPELVTGDGEEAELKRKQREANRKLIEDVIRNEDPRFVRERYYAELVALGDKVFPSWEDGEKHIVHLSKHYVPRHPVYCGIDFGYTNPTVAIWGEYNKNTHELLILDEYYRSRQAINVHIEAIINRFPQTRYYFPDPSAPQWAHELEKYLERTASVVPAPSREIMHGISLIEGMLFTGRIKVASHCEQLIRQMGSYAFRESRGKLVPYDKDNDCVDALRYLVVGIEDYAEVVGSWPNSVETFLSLVNPARGLQLLRRKVHQPVTLTT